MALNDKKKGRKKINTLNIKSPPMNVMMSTIAYATDSDVHTHTVTEW